MSNVVDLNNYKGVFYDDDNEKYQCPVTGAHFRPQDLCQRLEVIRIKRGDPQIEFDRDGNKIYVKSPRQAEPVGGDRGAPSATHQLTKTKHPSKPQKAVEQLADYGSQGGHHAGDEEEIARRNASEHPTKMQEKPRAQSLKKSLRQQNDGPTQSQLAQVAAVLAQAQELQKSLSHQAASTNAPMRQVEEAKHEDAEYEISNVEAPGEATDKASKDGASESNQVISELYEQEQAHEDSQQAHYLATDPGPNGAGQLYQELESNGNTGVYYRKANPQNGPSEGLDPAAAAQQQDQSSRNKSRVAQNPPNVTKHSLSGKRLRQLAGYTQKLQLQQTGNAAGHTRNQNLDEVQFAAQVKSQPSLLNSTAKREQKSNLFSLTKKASDLTNSHPEMYQVATTSARATRQEEKRRKSQRNNRKPKRVLSGDETISSHCTDRDPLDPASATSKMPPVGGKNLDVQQPQLHVRQSSEQLPVARGNTNWVNEHRQPSRGAADSQPGAPVSLSRAAKLPMTLANNPRQQNSLHQQLQQSQLVQNSSQNAASSSVIVTSGEREALQRTTGPNHKRKVSGILLDNSTSKGYPPKSKQVKSMLHTNESGNDFNSTSASKHLSNKDKHSSSNVEKMKQITASKVGEKRQFTNMFAKILVGQNTSTSNRQQKKLSKAELSAQNMSSKFLDGVKGASSLQAAANQIGAPNAANHASGLNYVSHGMIKPSHGLYTNRVSGKKVISDRQSNKIHKSASHTQLGVNANTSGTATTNALATSNAGFAMGNLVSSNLDAPLPHALSQDKAPTAMNDTILSGGAAGKQQSSQQLNLLEGSIDSSAPLQSHRSAAAAGPSQRNKSIVLKQNESSQGKHAMITSTSNGNLNHAPMHLHNAQNNRKQQLQKMSQISKNLNHVIAPQQSKETLPLAQNFPNSHQTLNQRLLTTNMNLQQQSATQQSQTALVTSGSFTNTSARVKETSKAFKSIVSEKSAQQILPERLQQHHPHHSMTKMPKTQRMSNPRSTTNMQQAQVHHLGATASFLLQSLNGDQQIPQLQQAAQQLVKGQSGVSSGNQRNKANQQSASYQKKVNQMRSSLLNQQDNGGALQTKSRNPAGSSNQNPLAGSNSLTTMVAKQQPAVMLQQSKNGTNVTQQRNFMTMTSGMESNNNNLSYPALSPTQTTATANKFTGQKSKNGIQKSNQNTLISQLSQQASASAVQRLKQQSQTHNNQQQTTSSNISAASPTAAATASQLLQNQHLLSQQAQSSASAALAQQQQQSSSGQQQPQSRTLQQLQHQSGIQVKQSSSNNKQRVMRGSGISMASGKHISSKASNLNQAHDNLQKNLKLASLTQSQAYSLSNNQHQHGVALSSSATAAAAAATAGLSETGANVNLTATSGRGNDSQGTTQQVALKYLSNQAYASSGSIVKPGNLMSGSPKKKSEQKVKFVRDQSK